MSITFANYPVDVTDERSIVKVMNRIGDDKIALEFKDLLRWNSDNVDALLANAIATYYAEESHPRLALQYELDLADITSRIPVLEGDAYERDRNIAFATLCDDIGLDSGTPYSQETIGQIIQDFSRKERPLELVIAALRPEAQRLMTDLGISRIDVKRPWRYLEAGRIDPNVSESHRLLYVTFALYQAASANIANLNATVEAPDDKF